MGGEAPGPVGIGWEGEVSGVKDSDHIGQAKLYGTESVRRLNLLLASVRELSQAADSAPIPYFRHGLTKLEEGLKEGIDSVTKIVLNLSFLED